jgi:predicted outer membrane repeat protein
MLYTDDLNGEVKCVEDNASCVLDGENDRRGMYASGTGSATLILRAVSFKDGKDDNGGGLRVVNGAVVEIHLCVFANCRATEKGGAIYASATGTVNIYGTSFNDNTSPAFGDDISSGKPGSLFNVIVHDTCPSPYSFNTPIQGKTNKERMAEAASTHLTSTTPTQLFTTQEHPLVLTMLSVAKSFHFLAVLTTPVMQVFRTQHVGSLFQIVQLARLERLATVEQRLV